jgi:hypothetical protein
VPDRTGLILPKDIKQMTQPDWPAWEMREVEHQLCEHHKYLRAREEGIMPRGRFRHA